MKSLVLIALLVSLILTGCTSDHAKLAKAADKIGQSRARVSLPDWPLDCRKLEAHAELALNQDAIVALKREREALNYENARVARCAKFYDKLAKRLK